MTEDSKRGEETEPAPELGSWRARQREPEARHSSHSRHVERGAHRTRPETGRYHCRRHVWCGWLQYGHTA